MAQRGDTFGKPTDFSVPERQKSLTPAGETYTGRVLFYWETLLGIQPPTSAWQGLKISGLGFPQDAPKPGTQTSSMFALIKQIQIDLAAIRIQNAAIVQGQAVDLQVQQSILAQQAAANTQAAQANAQMIALLTSIDSKV